jgi:hypothetical protein
MKKKPKKKKVGLGGAAGGSQVGHPSAAPPQADERDVHGRTQPEVTVPREKSPALNICFNCSELGHFQSACTAPEQYLFYGDTSHLAAACTDRFSCRKREVLEYLGHGIDGGFY